MPSALAGAFGFRAVSTCLIPDPKVIFRLFVSANKSSSDGLFPLVCVTQNQLFLNHALATIQPIGADRKSTKTSFKSEEMHALVTGFMKVAVSASRPLTCWARRL